jgi:hypothetical protein
MKIILPCIDKASSDINIVAYSIATAVVAVVILPRVCNWVPHLICVGATRLLKKILKTGTWEPPLVDLADKGFFEVVPAKASEVSIYR